MVMKLVIFFLFCRLMCKIICFECEAALFALLFILLDDERHFESMFVCKQQKIISLREKLVLCGGSRLLSICWPVFTTLTSEAEIILIISR